MELIIGLVVECGGVYIFCGPMVGLVVEFVRRCVHFLWSDGFWWMLVRVCAAVLFLRCVHSFVVRWILMDVNRTVCGQWQPPCAL